MDSPLKLATTALSKEFRNEWGSCLSANSRTCRRSNTRCFSWTSSIYNLTILKQCTWQLKRLHLRNSRARKDYSPSFISQEKLVFACEPALWGRGGTVKRQMEYLLEEFHLSLQVCCRAKWFAAVNPAIFSMFVVYICMLLYSFLFFTLWKFYKTRMWKVHPKNDKHSTINSINTNM